MSIHGSGTAASAPADDMPSAPTLEKGTNRTEAYTGRPTTRAHRALTTVERWGKMRAFGPLVGTIILIAVFGLLKPHLFFSAQEISGFTALGSSIGIVALGAGFLMISGEFDLSVASVFALAQVILGKLLNAGVHDLLALVIVFAIAGGVGLVNGVITTRFGIPSFITTLASFLAVGGINLILTQGNTILYFGSGIVRPLFGGSLNQYISAPLLWWIGLTVVGWYVLDHTRYGNWSRSAGGRAGAAFAMGVPARRVKTINFVVSACLAALSGCAQFAAYGAASASNGQDYELYAIVAAVIGGTSLFGVVGSMPGIFLGGLIIGLLQTGLVLVGVPGEWYTAVIGGILVVAVIVNVKLSGLGFGKLRMRLFESPGKAELVGGEP
jgi:simple sugar transport system permease protein